MNADGNDDITTVFGYPDAGVVDNITSIIDFDSSEYIAALATDEDPGTLLIYYTGAHDTAPTTAGAVCSVVYTNSAAEGERPAITVNTCVQ